MMESLDLKTKLIRNRKIRETKGCKKQNQESQCHVGKYQAIRHTCNWSVPGRKERVNGKKKKFIFSSGKDRQIIKTLNLESQQNSVR